MQLTVFVPILGTLIVFAEPVLGRFVPAAVFQDEAGIRDPDIFSLTNIYFTYFGLCCLSVAAIIFSMFCPKEIIEFPTLTSFLSASANYEGKTISKENFRRVLHLHFRRKEFLGYGNFEHHGITELPKYQREREDPEYTDRLESDFYALMEEMYTAYPHDPELDGGEGGMPEVMTATGYLDFTGVAQMLHGNPRVAWPITIPFFNMCPDFSREIGAMMYRALDLKSFRLRISIMIFFLVGFFLVSIPTLKTIFLILKSIFV